jgi:hypothetical protein
MSKLPEEFKFIDVSDYGRPIARKIAYYLKDTKYTAVDVTIAFIISGLIGVACILKGYYWAAGFFLVLKSILDAADGELSRMKETPSYIGRYLDSVADIILNFLILMAIAYITDSHFSLAFLAFIGVQLQGTLYNYYYVILRTKYAGDTTSRIKENQAPIALNGENQKHVDILYRLFRFFYGGFDKAIYLMDKSASTSKEIPKMLMTLVSTYGLGFQLLLISIFLIAGFAEIIIPFFIFYTLMIFAFIGLRRSFSNL